MAPPESTSSLNNLNKLLINYNYGPILTLIAATLSILIIVRILKIEARAKNRKRALSLKGQDLIEQFILDALETYDHMAKSLHTLFILLGFIAIVGSIFVTTFLSLADNDGSAQSKQMKAALPYIAFLSTTCLTLITAFDLSSKSNNCRKAWRYLQNEYEIFKAKPDRNLDNLIAAHKKAEEILGSVDFQYQGEQPH